MRDRSVSAGIEAGLEERLRAWSGRVLVGEVTDPPPVSDAASVTNFLHHHGITLCVRRALETRDTAEAKPLQDHAAAACAEDMARNHEFTRVVSSLGERLRFPPLIIKGQALAHYLYPQSHLRPRGDIDMLIEEADAASVFEVLKELGYERVFGIEGDQLLTQDAYRKSLLGVDHVWDVHWRISNRPALADTLSYQYLAASAVALHVCETVFNTPCPADSLLIACLHLAGHHFGNPRLVWLYDIHLLVADLSDSQRRRFVDTATSEPTVGSACHAALTLTCCYLPDPRTEELANDIDPGPAARYGPNRTYLTRLWEDLRAVDPSNRPALLRQHLLPKADYMMRRFNIRHRWQLPFWYAIRVGRAIPKLLKQR